MKEHCRKILHSAYLYLDGEVLSETERYEITAHLDECAPCYERYGVEEQVKQLLARLKGGCRCPDELRTKLSRMIDEAG
jgi:mycothiol system anti-sigma-R factor